MILSNKAIRAKGLSRLINHFRDAAMCEDEVTCEARFCCDLMSCSNCITDHVEHSPMKGSFGSVPNASEFSMATNVKIGMLTNPAPSSNISVNPMRYKLTSFYEYSRYTVLWVLAPVKQFPRQANPLFVLLGQHMKLSIFLRGDPVV